MPNNIIDVTALGPDLKLMSRAVDLAEKPIDGIKMTTAQTDLFPVLMQSLINGRTNVKKTHFRNIPIIEVL